MMKAVKCSKKEEIQIKYRLRMTYTANTSDACFSESDMLDVDWYDNGNFGEKKKGFYLE